MLIHELVARELKGWNEVSALKNNLLRNVLQFFCRVSDETGPSFCSAPL
jgi:hypothetical protein